MERYVETLDWQELSSPRPNERDLQTGDFLWPKEPGQYVPYRSGAETTFEEEEKSWVSEINSLPRGSLPDHIRSLAFRDFYEMYMNGAGLSAPVDQTARIPRFYVGHVGIVMVSDGVPYVVEALFGTGVGIRTYGDWVRGRSKALVWHGRMKGATDIEKAQIAAVAHSQIGKPFRFFNLNLLDTSGFYCSKLCWYSVWQATGRSLDNNPSPERSIWFSPKQMLRSDHIEPLLTPDGEYGLLAN